LIIALLAWMGERGQSFFLYKYNLQQCTNGSKNMKNHAVVSPEFWSPAQRHAMLPATVKLLLIYMIGASDKDGIASIPIGFSRNVNKDCQPMNEEAEKKCILLLEKIGSIAVYFIGGARWVWIPDRVSTQPLRGAYSAKRDTRQPPPPKEVVERLLRLRLHRDPTDKESKNASPRTFKSARSSAGVVEGDILIIWEAWRKRQIYPDRCVCSGPIRSSIRSSLEQATVDSIVDLFEFAFDSDEPAAKFWQGQNAQKRKYLGLDNLLRANKLQDRLQLVYAWKDAKDSDGPQSDFGSLAKYRTRTPAGTQSFQKPEPVRHNTQRGKILSMLKERGLSGATTSELAEIGCRYGARVGELRGMGYKIEVSKGESGNNLYTLVDLK